MPTDFLSKEYSDDFEIKNEIFEKYFDTLSLDVELNYRSDFWHENHNVGGFVSSTYLYSETNRDDMETLFDSYLAGRYFFDIKTSNIRYEENETVNLNFPKYKVYDIYLKNDLKAGTSINVLKGNKIINAAIVSKTNFQVDLEQLLDKIEKI